MRPSSDATTLLQALPEGGPQVAERLFHLVFDELHRLAEAQFRRERADHTLQPTALVNEVFLRLIGQTRTDWKSRAHFLAVAARAMRQILVDHARSRERAKRGGQACRVAAGELVATSAHADPDLLDLEEALERFAALDQRQSRIVELRFFGGMTVPEIAHVLSVSKTTVEADWRMARAWLRRELVGGSGP